MRLMRKGKQSQAEKRAKAPAGRLVIVTCPGCQRGVKLERCIRRRAVPGVDGVSAVGIDCPHCHHWTHSFYETPDVVRARADLKQVQDEMGPSEAADEAKRQYEKIYEGEQVRVAALLLDENISQ